MTEKPQAAPAAPAAPQPAKADAKESSEPSPAPKQPSATLQVEALAGKLGIECTPEMLLLTTNEQISEALVAAALKAGKSEAEITAAMT